MNALIQEVYPLAPGQGGILFDAIGGGALADSVIQVVVDCSGAADDAADDAAWAALIRRHDALRTAFVWQGQKQPLQVVGRHAAPRIGDSDLSQLDPAQQAARIQEWLDRDRVAGFDLTRAPLLRIQRFRLAPDRHRLVVTFHHAILDGWSVPILLRDWIALRAGAALPDALPFRDHVAWALAQDRAAARAFWRAELAGAKPAGRLPAPARPPADRRAEIALRLDPGDSRALALSLRRSGVTLATAVQGAWALMMARASGQSETVFGLARAGRPAALAGADRRVGMYLAVLPVRAVLTPGQSVSAWLAGLQDRLHAQTPHEHLPLPEALAAAGHGGASLLGSVVVFQNYPSDPALLGQIPGLRIKAVSVMERGGLGLTLYATARDGLELRLVFDAAATCADAARLALEDLRRILSVIAHSPDMPLDRIGVDSRASLPADPAPVPQPPAQAIPGMAAAGGLGSALARIWAEVLDSAPPHPHENFFDLGGHSLLVIALQDRIRRDLGLTVQIADLFHHATLAAQAAHLTRLSQSGTDQPDNAPAADTRLTDARLAGAQRLRQRRDLRAPSANATKDPSHA